MSLNLNSNEKGDIQPLDPDPFLPSLSPVSYLVEECPCGRRHIGFVPSATASPQAAIDGYATLNGNAGGIRIVRANDEHMRISEQEVLSVLWAKVQQLSARVAELEATP